jgi:beta-galactosidase
MLWSDVLAPTTGKAVGLYRGQYYAGRVAATLNSHGRGKVLYVGTLGGEALHKALVLWATRTAGIKPALETPEGVEATERWKGESRFLFVLNHSDGFQQVVLPERGFDLLSGEELGGTVDLEAKAVLILQTHPDSA